MSKGYTIPAPPEDMRPVCRRCGTKVSYGAVWSDGVCVHCTNRRGAEAQARWEEL